MFQTNVIGKIKISILCSVTFFMKIVPFIELCLKVWYSRVGLRLQHNRVHALLMLDT
jgi:hypothetical protein